jgi:hypothetical protein
VSQFELNPISLTSETGLSVILPSTVWSQKLSSSEFPIKTLYAQTFSTVLSIVAAFNCSEIGHNSRPF